MNRSMQKISLFLSLRGCTLIALLVLCSCEQLVQDLPTLSTDKEAIVIGAMLTAGDSLHNVFISNTIPAFDTPNSDNVTTSSATVTLAVDGVVYTMRPQPPSTQYTWQDLKGTFFEVPNLMVEAGKHYEITVRLRGNIAHAATFVPLPVVADSLRLYERSGRELDVVMDAVIQGRPNEVYFLTQRHIDSSFYNGNPVVYFYAGEASEPKFINTSTDGKKTVTLQALLNGFFVPRVQGRLNQITSFAHIFAFDAAYLDYYNTRGRAKYDGNPFVLQGVNVQGNVTGDGVGVFIGVNLTVIKIPKM